MSHLIELKKPWLAVLSLCVNEGPAGIVVAYMIDHVYRNTQICAYPKDDRPIRLGFDDADEGSTSFCHFLENIVWTVIANHSVAF